MKYRDVGLVFAQDEIRNESLWTQLNKDGFVKYDGDFSYPPPPRNYGFFGISPDQKTDFLNEFNLYEDVGGKNQRRTANYNQLKDAVTKVCLRHNDGRERVANIDGQILGWIATYLANDQFYDYRDVRGSYKFVASAMSGNPNIKNDNALLQQLVSRFSSCWSDMYAPGVKNPVVDTDDGTIVSGIYDERSPSKLLFDNYRDMDHVMILAGESDKRAVNASRMSENCFLHSTDSAIWYYGAPELLRFRRGKK